MIMLEDVVIHMHSVQNSDQDECDTLDFCTDGQYMVDGDTVCFSYMETEVTGMDGTRTSVFVRPNEVVVDRDGTVTSRMVFRERERNKFIYNTPNGSPILTINTRSIRHRFNDDGGELEVDYVLDVEHFVVSRNKIFIRVEKQKKAE